MFSEIGSWVHDESDGPDIDLGTPHPPEVSGGAGEAGGHPLDLDDFLGDYEQAQAPQWSASDSSLPPHAAVNQNIAVEATPKGVRDNCPLLLEEGLSSSHPSSPAKTPTMRSGLASSASSFPSSRGLMGRCNHYESTFSSQTTGKGLGAILSFLKCLGNRWKKGILRGPLCAAGFRGLCRAVYYSRLMAYMYIGVLALNAWILIRYILCSPVDCPLVIAEAFVSLMLLLEVALRALVMGPAFFSSCAHLFDCGVTVLCLALLIGSGDLQSLSRRPRAPPESPDDVLRPSLTALRVSTQLMRIVPLALHQKRARLPRDEVDFSRLGVEDDL
ncbi:uncharacterized protein LOC34622744 [Cyclospora cayetanensis]|uniref:Uncharacterized protein n=2 Tax=Cyclospora cayetanensis TaxID=88456 RepID=A0A1D3CSE7_9EIME|nr:uncharacterized protein LOC34622744 [Cyclospora cayetanensis]OEH74112.1 hypothetical protein cyc_06620 [Cyclospora cayetanensis]